MKKLLTILMFIPFLSIGQVPITMEQEDVENWTLLQDSSNIERYNNPDLNCEVAVYYESDAQNNIALMEFLFQKSNHSMVNYINDFDENFDRVHNHRLWVMNNRDSYYKIQIIERGNYNQYFSVLIQKHSY